MFTKVDLPRRPQGPRRSESTFVWIGPGELMTEARAAAYLRQYLTGGNATVRERASSYLLSNKLGELMIEGLAACPFRRAEKHRVSERLQKDLAATPPP